MNPEDAFVKEALLACDHGELHDAGEIGLDRNIVLDWLHRLARHCGKPAFPDQPEPGWGYHFDNNAFAWGDGTVYSGMIQELRPKRIIEVGAGYSSCLAMDVNDRMFAGGGRKSRSSIRTPIPCSACCLPMTAIAK